MNKLNKYYPRLKHFRAYSPETVLLLLSRFMVIILAGLSSACLAKDYYVATDGSDTHPGSQTEPWKTIQHAADSLQPGDTVYIRGGVYRECVQPGRGGTSEGKRITIDQDLLGNVRHRAHPAAGPLETVAAGKQNSVTLIAGPRTQRETASAPI